MNPMRRASLVLPILLLVGCTDIPSVPLVGNAPPPPTVSGTVSNASGSALRVGLIGAGQGGTELVSAPVTGGSYTLTFPASVPLSAMEANETQSIAFSLQVYNDANGNGQYDAGEETGQASSAAFRFFTSDGPAGQYQKGWNVSQGGAWSQSFNTAYNVSSLDR